MPHRPIVRRTAKQVVELWVKALRSGKCKQAQGIMVRDRDTASESFCCLGVLQDLAKKDGGYLREYGGVINHDQWDTLGLGINQHYLARMNDTGTNFAHIADFIEKNATPT